MPHRSWASFVSSPIPRGRQRWCGRSIPSNRLHRQMDVCRMGQIAGQVPTRMVLVDVPAYLRGTCRTVEAAPRCRAHSRLKWNFQWSM
jgi:hypothetical protein